MKKKGLLSSIISSMPGFADKSARPASRLNIDYPEPGEKILVGHYAVRISGSKGDCEAAIEDGGWAPCRCAGGYSWFDWYPTKAGTYRILVRARNDDKWVKIQRTCRVV